MLKETLSAARDLGRLHEIATILIRWGFGDVVNRLGVARILERAGKVLHWKDMQTIRELTPPQRLRHAMEELGPTFIKLGQVLSTRMDLFAPEWIEAFEAMQDDVPALPYDSVVSHMQQALGDDPEKIFRSIEKEAIAAASIAQVYRAVTHDGDNVIVKLRRPNIVERVDKDLRLLQRLAEIAANNIDEIKRFQPLDIVHQFGQSLRRELNLETECRFAERISANLSDEKHIVIPRVYWQWTSETLNVQEYIDGVRGTNQGRLDELAYNKKLIAKYGADAVLKMVIRDGLFHADPHLGNMICLPDQRIALIDFGMVGRLSDQRREEVTDLLFALVKKDPQGVLEVVLLWNPDTSINETRLFADIDDFLDTYHGLDLKELRFTDLLTDLVRIIRTNELRMPPDLTLLIKAFITLEGVGKRLDPDFNIVSEATPFITQIIHRRYRPDVVAKKGFEQTAQFIENVADLPKEAKDLLRSIKRGGLQLNIDMTRLDHFGHQVDRAASRLTIGIVIAALIIGTSIVTATQPETTVLGLPVWGIIGFITAALGGVWLLISIWRGSRD
ncbi:MAG: AarF/UbiB family protein [Gammaproteobacteria bacterium]|nr:AarF/UbiB family protein [Gammaproteobacteria bacterium]